MHGQCNSRPTVTFPAAGGHHHPFNSTALLTVNNLYCLMTEAHVRENKPKVIAWNWNVWELNLRHLSRKLNALTIEPSIGSLHATFGLISTSVSTKSAVMQQNANLSEFTNLTFWPQPWPCFRLKFSQIWGPVRILKLWICLHCNYHLIVKTAKYCKRIGMN